MPQALKQGMTSLDIYNLNEYRIGKVKAFDKKRKIEKNTMGINKDFSALKTRIIEGNQVFKKHQFGGSGAERCLDGNLTHNQTIG